MGLSCKQVSGDGVDWGQTLLENATMDPTKNPQLQPQPQLKQSERLKCPRCDSTNTKFCYYNNYNKSQPRHFCKSCKRHWTKGGTLRNIPVGGGRKNKRLKTSTAAIAAGETDSININQRNTDPQMAIQTQKQHQSFPLPLCYDQKSISQILFESLIHPPSSSLQHDFIKTNFFCSGNNEIFQDSFPFPRQNQNLRVQSPGSFESNLSSISSPLQSSTGYYYMGGPETATEDLKFSNLAATTTSSFADQPWQVPTSRGLVEGSYWAFDDDMNVLVSADLNLPSDDPEGIKPFHEGSQ